MFLFFLNLLFPAHFCLTRCADAVALALLRLAAPCARHIRAIKDGMRSPVLIDAKHHLRLANAKHSPIAKYSLVTRLHGNIVYQKAVSSGCLRNLKNAQPIRLWWNFLR